MHEILLGMHITQLIKKTLPQLQTLFRHIEGQGILGPGSQVLQKEMFLILVAPPLQLLLQLHHPIVTMEVDIRQPTMAGTMEPQPEEPRHLD
jgi:hypothetical protein